MQGSRVVLTGLKPGVRSETPNQAFKNVTGDRIPNPVHSELEIL